MKLISSTLISWNEPWFFLIRIRTVSGWLKRIGVALVIAIVMFIAMYFLDNGRFGLTEAILVALACGGVMLLLMDKGNIQREVTVKDDSIIVNSAAGNSWFETFKFDAIESIQLMRPEEWSHSVGGMLIETDDDVFMVAIPHKVNIDTVANILYRQDLLVSLTGWEPPEHDTRHSVMDDLELDTDKVVGFVETESLEGVEPKLLTPMQIAVQLVIALGPLLIALGLAIWAGIHLYQNWDAIDWINKSLIGGGAFVAFILSFIYLIQVGQFVAAAYGIGQARKAMQRRSSSPFSGLEEDLVTVELFSREKWTAVTAMADDFGFLQIDRPQRILRYEGNKNRWMMPFGALKTCRIEESIVGSEGNQNPEKRYYVVLAAGNEGDEDDWEYGLIYTRTEVGRDTYEKRYERSKLFYTQLAHAIG